MQGGGGIETLAAVPLTINEMLLQSYEGIIRVFPNWNRKKDASFENLRAYGAFLVTSTLKEGLIQGVTLVSEKGRVCKIENPWKGRPVQVIRENGKADILYGEYLQIPTVVSVFIRFHTRHFIYCILNSLTTIPFFHRIYGFCYRIIRN